MEAIAHKATQILLLAKKEMKNYFKDAGLKIVFLKNIGNILESLIRVGKFNNLSKNFSIRQVVNHYEFHSFMSNKQNLFLSLMRYCEV
jgi:hypothetical protein